MTRNELKQLCDSYGWYFREDGVFCYQLKNYIHEWVKPFVILTPESSEPIFRWMVNNEHIFQHEYNTNWDLQGYVQVLDEFDKIFGKDGRQCNAFSGLENLKTLIDNHLAEHKIQTRDSKKLDILHCGDEWQV